mgnify:FL=1
MKSKVLNIFVIIVSDSRDESSDKSGKVLMDRIHSAGHSLVNKIFIKDEVEDIKKKLNKLIKEKTIDVIILSGGTGLTGRDSTPEAVKSVIKKEIPGFGEIFRFISFKKIATSALQSRALAGLANDKFIFSLPGSPGACKDAWDEILVHQLNSNTKPCNLVELIPRLKER